MIKILYAYPELLNIFGAAGDVDVLAAYIKACGEEVQLDRIEVGDAVSLSDYDMLYFGAGTEDRTIIALKDIKHYEGQLKDYINAGGNVLMIGTASMLVYSDIVNTDGSRYEGLGIVSGTARIYQKKDYSDVIGSCSLCETPIMGAINSSVVVDCVKSAVADENVKAFITLDFDSNSYYKNTASETEALGHEGYVYKNCIGTEVFGPVFARNPEFLAAFCKDRFNIELKGEEPTWLKEARLGYEYAINLMKSSVK